MYNFTAIDPNFEQRVRSSFDRQQAMKTLNMRLQRVEEGEVSLNMPYQTDYAQQHGFVHAGIVATGLDNACGYAAFSLMPAEAAVLTVEFKINLLAPAQGEFFEFVGTVVKPGRTITVCEGKAFAIDNQKRKLIATMNATLMALFDRKDIAH